MALRFAAIIAVILSLALGGCPEFTAVDEPVFAEEPAEGENAAPAEAAAAPAHAEGPPGVRVVQGARAPAGHP